MKAPLRVLIVEDSPEDAALLVAEVRRAGHEVVHRRVETREALVEALASEPWDVVLSDYNLPWFHGPGALQVVRESGRPVPFLLVSGAIGESLAVHAVKQGAADYVMKGNLARLVPAIERAIREERANACRADTERRLRESEERYRRFFEEDLTGDFVADGDGGVRACNPAYARTFGYASVDEALGTRLPLLPEAPAERETFLALLRRRGKLEYHEAALLRRDGEALHVVANLIGAWDDDGRLTEIRGYVFDDTERTRLEEQLRRAQKMEAVGRLASGIAHDFNNLLTAVVGYADLLIHAVVRGDPLRGYAEEIRRAGERASTLVRQLLVYARRQALRPAVLDPNEVVSSLEGLLRRLVGADVELRLSLDPRVPPVLADRGPLEQVLLNLAVNARDAMPRGGVLAIETGRVEEDGRDEDGAEPGAWARISVADTGCGIPEDVRPRVFEPFFTTKDPSRGTGLGLATSQGIVAQSGGRLSFETEVGRGTVFHVRLPAAAGRRVEVAAAPEADGLPRARGRGETVLLVEDDAVVRRLLARGLVDAGYRVLEAGDAREALSACDRHAGPVHVLVTDLVLPRMGGRELAARVAVLRPGTRVVFVSGHAGDAAAREGDDLAAQDVLAKPFTPEALADRVREVLSEARRDLPLRVRSA